MKISKVEPKKNSGAKPHQNQGKQKDERHKKYKGIIGERIN
ncbi:hypothetical protein [Serratia proteamaculans]|nr:hypothetical protein [Serratia proteamaculans]